MTINITDNLHKITETIKLTALSSGRENETIDLLIVTKNQPRENILPLLLAGQRCFGENRVQAAISKWQDLKQQFKDIELHLIGHLQTNKVKEAVQSFDVIQSLDSSKLAKKLAAEEAKQKKYLKYFIEINVANEPQKSGIKLAEADAFIQFVKENTALNIRGLMCIPPAMVDPRVYFLRLKELAIKHSLPELSMGMSGDYPIAITCGATMVRIGHAIFAAN